MLIFPRENILTRILWHFLQQIFIWIVSFCSSVFLCTTVTNCLKLSYLWEHKFIISHPVGWEIPDQRTGRFSIWWRLTVFPTWCLLLSSLMAEVWLFYLDVTEGRKTKGTEFISSNTSIKTTISPIKVKFLYMIS